MEMATTLLMSVLLLLVGLPQVQAVDLFYEDTFESYDIGDTIGGKSPPNFPGVWGGSLGNFADIVDDPVTPGNNVLNTLDLPDSEPPNNAIHGNALSTTWDFAGLPFFVSRFGLSYDVFARSSQTAGEEGTKRSHNGGFGFPGLTWFANTNDGQKIWFMDGRGAELQHSRLDNDPPVCCPEVGVGGAADNLGSPGADVEVFDKWTSWELIVDRNTGQVITTVRDRDGGGPTVRIDDGSWILPSIGGGYGSLGLFVDTRGTTGFLFDNIRVIPEPVTFALMGLGALGLLGRPRRKR